MTLQQLRYLCAVADCGFNISRAAEVLHTSQPGMSKQIALLEEELKIGVFVRRKGRMVDVSARGAEVLEVARRILKDAGTLRSIGAESVEAEGGHLALSLLHVHARYLLIDEIAQFRRNYPGVRVDLLQGSPGRISDLVMSGEAEIGVTIEPVTQPTGLLQITCRPVARSVFVPLGHPLLRVRKPTLHDIAMYPLIAVDPSCAMDWAIRRAFHAHGIEPNVAVHAGDATVIKAYVEQGLGICVLPSAAFEPARDKGLRIIDATDLFGDSRLKLIIDPYRYLRSFAYDFIELVAPEWTREKVDAAMAQQVREERARPRSLRSR